MGLFWGSDNCELQPVYVWFELFCPNCFARCPVALYHKFIEFIGKPGCKVSHFWLFFKVQKACNRKSCRDQQLVVPVKHNTQITQRQFQPQLVHSGRKDYQSQLIQFSCRKIQLHDTFVWWKAVDQPLNSFFTLSLMRKLCFRKFCLFQSMKPSICMPFVQRKYTSFTSSFQSFTGFIMFLGSGDFMWDENHDYD